MIRCLTLIFVICFSFCANANYVHQFQLSTTIAKYYQNVDGGYTAVPITGTQNIIVEIVDVDLEQPIWVFSEEQDVDNGSITMVVSDSDIDWVTELETRSLIFRISVLEDQIDIPFEYLPFSVHSDKAYQFKQFNNEDISYIDYDSQSWVINDSTLNAELAVSGSIVADKLIGSGEGLVNLTGPGFNDGHSLNSENGIYKDVLYVDATGNVGIFTLTPNARLHLKGSVAFQGDILDIDDYSLPTGNLLFWDPNRASFRSGVFNTSLSSSDIGYYSIGFGEDIQASARYSVILGGEDHSIDSAGKSSVILGGQAHQIFNSYSIAIGGYLSMIFGEWSVLFGGYENTSYGNYQVILGGENNFIKGMHNLVVGSDNFIDSEYSVVIGSQNSVSANRSVVFGNSVNISNSMDYSFVYSNSSSEFSPSSNSQFLINADGGVGINRIPSSDMSLSVSGDFYATQFIGDGQNLYNIQDYESFWKSTSGGIYYLDGNVAIGTTNIMASLTVDGAITLGSSQQLENALTPVNGTLHFDNESDLLQFYINEWVTVNMQDTDTLITFDDDDIELSVSTIDYLKFIEDLDSVDYIFGSNGVLKNGLLEWFSDAGFYAGDFVWFDNQSESRDLEIISMINKADEGNSYSYKWSGYFIPKDTDVFYFKTVSDELSHVVINNSIIVNNDDILSEGSIYLQENVAYSIEIYFGEDTGDANMNFYWKGGAQIDYTNDLSSYFYVLLDSDFDISQYGLFYQTLAVNTISISDKGADDEDVLRYNGSDWFPYNAKVWTDTDNGLYLDQDLNVSVSGNSYEYPLVIGSNPDLDGSSLAYPLAMGVTDTLLFSPRDASLMINIDFEDDTKSNYVLNSSSSLVSDGYENYGALINVEDDVFKLHFTDQAYTVGDVVQLDTVFNLSVDSLYLDTNSPQATFDTQGSVAFLNTYVDHRNFNDLIGFGHASHLEYDYPYYLYLDDDFELNINSGIDTLAQPIQFLIDGNRKGYFNSLGELIIGDDEARAKVSVFDGGIALNVNGGQFGSASYAGKRFSVSSQSFIDPSIVFEYGNNIIVDMGDEKFSLGSEQSSSLMTLYSEDVPDIKLYSEGASRFVFEGETENFTLKNDQGNFYIMDDDQIYFYHDSDDRMGILTDSVSSLSKVAVDGDIELSNNDRLIFSNDSRLEIMSFSKDVNNLVIQQENSSPLRINSIEQSPILLVSANGTVAIKSSTVTDNAALYVVGDTLLNDVIYYRISGDDKRIQSFSVSDNITEIRSVKRLVVDESSGIRLELDSEDMVTLRAPGVYEKIYDTDENDDYVQPIGKDTLRFIEHAGGLKVSLLDTNDDGVSDSVELYNTLIDGGVINGDVTVNGSVYVEQVSADGSEVYNIPFYWQLNGFELYYSSGNVGISIASPNYELDVRDVAFTDEMHVSENAYIKQIDFQDATITQITDEDIIFSIDTDNNETQESFLFTESDQPLLTIMEDDFSTNYAKVGLYTEPNTNFHVFTSDAPTSVLLKGESKSGILFQGDSLGAHIYLNPSSGSPDYGLVDQFIIQSDTKMRFNVDGATGLYLTGSSVSIGDNTDKNTFYVNGNSRIGTGYAEDSSIDAAFNGMIVEGSGSVGSSIAATGFQFYSKNNMSIGENADSIISDRSNFKGVVVEDRVGVGIDDPIDLFSVDGDVKISNKVNFYEDGVSQFFIHPNGQFSVDQSLSEDLVFQLSEYLSFSVGTTRAMTIYDNSVSIGTITTKDDDGNLVLYDDTDAMATFEDLSSNPTVTFVTKNGGRNGMMGINDSGDFLIESNGSNLNDPDIVVQSSEVGMGKTPSYTLDVDGDVKVTKIYQTVDGSDTRIYPVPIGAIVMWSGSVDAIPTGWQLCDGTSVTDKYGQTKSVPDLRNRFIRGWNHDGTSPWGVTGGVDQVSNDISDATQNGQHTHTDGSHDHSISGDSHNHGVNISSSNFHSTTSSSVTHPGTSGITVYSDSGGTQFYRSTSHSHSNVNTGHTHGLGSITSADGAHHDQLSTTSGSHEHDGGEHQHSWDNRPQYYVLAFIIKIN